MGAPAGFKLNNNLDNFLGTMFLWFIDLWLEFLKNLEKNIPTLVRFFGVGGLFGFSFICAATQDFICILTLHLFLFYTMAATMFRFHLYMLLSLFQIFRGKKRNVLRNRVDDCEYDLDQVLLGTILFTCDVFLFPTILVYYILFMGSRLLMILIYAILELCLAILYLFPFFTSFLYFYKPSVLPGGLKWSLCESDHFLVRHHHKPSSSKSNRPEIPIDSFHELLHTATYIVLQVRSIYPHTIHFELHCAFFLEFYHLIFLYF
jgi:hypothetical protein